ncbi:hypothetical protein EDB85DRAFT_2038942 [Lactarius pseudohatsudake]|nr:hypothetical protein EDB85DRAFT_2038942 [Lactarius pseudohatsudake]
MDILCAVRPAAGEHTTGATVLTAVRNLRVQGPVALDGPLFDAARQFTTSRQRLGHPVQLELSCSICGDGFGYPELLRGHLVDEHAYRLMCSYCGDFECTPGNNDLFPEHLKSKHPEVARNDSLVSKPYLRYFELVILAYQHSSPRAPELHPPPR